MGSRVKPENDELRGFAFLSGPCGAFHLSADRFGQPRFAEVTDHLGDLLEQFAKRRVFAPDQPQQSAGAGCFQFVEGDAAVGGFLAEG